MSDLASKIIFDSKYLKTNIYDDVEIEELDKITFDDVIKNLPTDFNTELLFSLYNPSENNYDFTPEQVIDLIRMLDYLESPKLFDIIILVKYSDTYTNLRTMIDTDVNNSIINQNVKRLYTELDTTTSFTNLISKTKLPYEYNHKLFLENVFKYGTIDLFVVLEKKLKSSSFSPTFILFFLTCCFGRKDFLNHIVNLAYDIDKFKSEGLYLACEYGHLQIVKSLVELNTDIHINKGKCFLVACEKGFTDIVEYYIQENLLLTNSFETGLKLASNNGQLNVIKYLFGLIDKMDLNFYSCITEHIIKNSIKNNQFDVFKWICDEIKIYDINLNLKLFQIEYICQYGKASMIEYLIDTIGLKIELFSNELLLVALIQGNLNVLQYLISQGMNAQNQDALKYAIKRDKFECFKLLYDNFIDKQNVNIMCICQAIIKNNLQVIEYIIEMEPNLVNNIEIYNDIYRQICFSDMYNLLEYFLNLNNYSMTHLDLALSSSIRYNNYSFIKHLVNLGANINDVININEALIIACRVNRTNCLKFYIELGADIHYQNDQALITACEEGNVDIVKYLLDLGLDVNTRNTQSLIMACRYGYIDIVKCLVESGANVRAQNNLAITIATEFQLTQMLNYLNQFL